MPAGRLWVMGDHRSASGDSLEHWERDRATSQVARSPRDSIVGRAFTVFWPVSRATWLSVPKEFDSIPDPRPPSRLTSGTGRRSTHWRNRLGRGDRHRPPRPPGCCSSTRAGAHAAAARRRSGPRRASAAGSPPAAAWTPARRPPQGAARELLEETGLRVDAGRAGRAGAGTRPPSSASTAGSTGRSRTSSCCGSPSGRSTRPGFDADRAGHDHRRTAGGPPTSSTRTAEQIYPTELRRPAPSLRTPCRVSR